MGRRPASEGKSDPELLRVLGTLTPEQLLARAVSVMGLPVDPAAWAINIKED